MNKIEPKEPTEFWCNKCDRVVVNSMKPETGSFFVQFGHAYDKEAKAYSGEYVGVMYALCHNCQ